MQQQNSPIIVIVDDEPMIGDLFSFVPKRAGDTASKTLANGNELLDCLKSLDNDSALCFPDLVLLDY